MSATSSAIAILAVFVLLDACKHWISHARGTGHAWLLQQDIIALRRSIARGSASPRAAAAAAAAAAAPSDPDRARPFVSVAHARERLLRDKERALTRAQTPALRRAMFLSHYLHVAKGVFGVGVVLALWSGDEPLFEVQRNAVWPLGRWLAAPHGQSWEAGAVAVTPWTLLSGAFCVPLSDANVCVFHPSPGFNI